MLPVDVPAMLTAPLVPASILRAVAAVETEMVGAVEVKVKAVEDTLIVSIEATPVRAPPLVTLRPEDAMEKVSSLELPMVIVLAATPVPINKLSALPSSPILMVPVVPELIVRAEAVAEDRVTAPLPVKD